MILIIVLASIVGYFYIGHKAGRARIPQAWRQAKAMYEIGPHSDVEYWKQRRKEHVLWKYSIMLLFWPFIAPFVVISNSIYKMIEAEDPDLIKKENDELKETIAKMEKELHIGR